MSDIEYTFWQNLDTTNVQVLGISVGESDEVAQTFARTFGLTFPVLRDPSTTTYSNYRISGITPYPRDYIVGPDGELYYAHSEYDPQEMLETIRELLATAIDIPEKENIPGTFRMQHYPNPANASVTIEFTIPYNRPVRLGIYDLNGRRVHERRIEDHSNTGRQRIRLDMSGLASGIYFARMSNGLVSERRKIVLIR